MEEILYNLKIITDMKNQLLKDVGEIFEYSSQGGCKEELTGSLASCVLAVILLGKRYGIGEELLFKEVMKRVDTGIADRHICETRFNDLSQLAKYIRGD